MNMADIASNSSSKDPREQIRAARFLRAQAPTWTLGIEEAGSARSLAHGLADAASGSAEAALLAPAWCAWALQRRPMDLNSGPEGSLAALASDMPSLPQPLRTMARTLRARLAPALPGQERQAIDDLLNAGEAALAARHLMPRLLNPETAPGWLALAWDRLLRMGNQDLPLSLLETAALNESLAPLRARLKAEWAFLYLSPAEARAHVQAVDKERFGLWRRYLLAELALREGDTAQGTDELAGLWRHMAWHPHMTLKLRSLKHRAEPAPKDDFATTAILLYSWNKADLLADTLKSLAQSDLRSAQIFVLDNGSSDHMQDAIAAAAQVLGPSLHSLRLPVNVGAPAARNWLLSLPEVRAMTWAAFLDDDVRVPPDWLERLHAAANEAEASGRPADVVGCRITSAGLPRTLQSADYHLLPPTDSVKTFTDYGEKIMVFENCGGDYDLGLFTYRRPATSVSGCCHLLSMASVQEHGDFDIRFTPTQFDDLERDLRLGCAERNIAYAGDLAIEHIQHSSLAKAQSLKSIGHVFGNKIKLEGKYGLAEIQTLQGRMAARLERDLAGAEDELLEACS